MTETCSLCGDKIDALDEVVDLTTGARGQRRWRKRRKASDFVHLDCFIEKYR